jgi:hypothetical protein
MGQVTNPYRAMGRSLAPAFLLLCLVVPVAKAQDPGKIIDQYVRASGGAKALSRIRTLAIEGTFTDAEGKAGSYTLDTKLPNRLYSELLFGEHGVIEAYNGKSAWHRTADGALGTLTGEEGMQLEAASQVYNTRFLDLRKNKIAATFVGHAQVKGKDALQVEVTTATGIKRKLFFDPQSHLLVKDAASLGGINEENLYDDYRPESGVQVAHRIELHRDSASYDITVTRAVVNGTIGERVFDFPIKSQVQLPDLKALFKEIDENQKAIDKIKENYTGTRSEEETEYDKNGKISKQERKEYTFFYLNGEEISTLVKKDGKALSESEQNKENEKTQKRIEEIQKKQAKKEAKEEKAKEEKAKQEKADGEGKEAKEDDPDIEVFLHVCQFVNPRRERFRGQDVLVFDFEPNPEYKAKKLVEKVVQKLAGVVWIDEKAHDVARLEAYFVGDFRLAGGLVANLQKGTSFVYEQAYVNNEVWLPTYEEAHVGVRVLLVKGFKVNAVTRYSDYKRFNVETLSTIGKPKETANETKP